MRRRDLLGLAVGDAVGTTLEFRSPGTFEPIDDMVGGGPFDLLAGAWTDDTMAACLAESLVESGGFDPDDQMLAHHAPTLVPSYATIRRRPAPCRSLMRGHGRTHHGRRTRCFALAKPARPSTWPASTSAFAR